MFITFVIFLTYGVKATLSKDFLLCDKEIKLHEHNAQINPNVYRMFW